MMSTKEKETNRLIKEINAQGIKTPSEVSKYIREGNLRNRYSHIAGKLEMENDESHWTFYGGLSPETYARVCIELGYDKKSGNGKPKKFTPYAKQGEKSYKKTKNKRYYSSR